MATGPLSIKLRCASWQQLATIYKHDLSRGAMFLRASTPPPIGTEVRIDLTLPSASVIALNGVVEQHVTDPQRGAGVELKLEPLPAQSVWLIESALAAESNRRKTPPVGVPVAGMPAASQTLAITESEDVSAAEQDLIKALIAEAESLKKLNPFLVLGVGYEATDADVRAAFGELTKRYHPDLFARYQSTRLRQLAAEIFILIRDAYRRLGDETGRAQALTSLGRAPAPRAVPMRAPTPAPVPNIPPPRPSTKPAGVQPPPPVARPESQPIPNIKESELIPLEPPVDGPTVKPVDPVAIPREALRTNPPPTRPATAPARQAQGPTTPLPPSPPAAKGTSPAQSTPRSEPPPVNTDRKPVLATPPPVLTEISDGDPIDDLIEQGKFDEAIVAAKVMAKRHPNDRTFRAAIEVCEGLRSLAARDRLEAAQRFEAALEIDPSNERAARELADMRRQATNERKGLLTRLMGKKE